MIPALLTQTWRTLVLQPEAARLRRGWMKRHPDFECRLFDDADCRSLVADVVPEGLAAYDALRYPVMRADVFRYAAMVRDGGVYADVDMECLRPIDGLLDGRRCLLAVEARLTGRRARELGYPAPYQIANCVFAAEPGHAFFREALARALALGPAVAKREDVEDATGPRMLTRLFFERDWNVDLASPIALTAPLHYPDIWPLNARMHARHRAFGVWKRPSRRTWARRWIERDRWVNPFPARLAFPAEEWRRNAIRSGADA